MSHRFEADAGVPFYEPGAVQLRAGIHRSCQVVTIAGAKRFYLWAK